MLKINFKNKSALIILIGLIIIAAYYAGLGKWMERYFAYAINPLNRVSFLMADSLGDLVSFYLSKQDYRQENERLRQKLIELSGQQAERQRIKAENELLKRELKFVDEYNYHSVTARVLGRSLNYETANVLINKGSKDGISDGLAVTADQGVIVGKIFGVKDNVSQVRFLSDNQNKLAVSVIGSDGSSLGLAVGEHNINIKIDMLAKDALIGEGDIVTTSGMEENIPAGLLLGHIRNVFHREEKVWQEALAEPMVNYNEIRIVTVILPAASARR